LNALFENRARFSGRKKTKRPDFRPAASAKFPRGISLKILMAAASIRGPRQSGLLLRTLLLLTLLSHGNHPWFEVTDGTG
jgi:hypothetical protein